MKLFLDTTDINEISLFTEAGVVAGVTTNPSLIAASGKNIFDVIKGICSITNGPVSVEVISTEASDMIKEGLALAKISSNIAIKIPLTWDGLKACKYFSSKGIMTNVTLCFSANQALLAANAGATFVSIFVGRQDDIGSDGMQIVEDVSRIYEQHPDILTKVIVASIRSPLHVQTAATIGADICTVPPKVMKKLIAHPLTTQGLDQFLKDWNKTNQKILQD